MLSNIKMRPSFSNFDFELSRYLKNPRTYEGSHTINIDSDIYCLIESNESDETTKLYNMISNMAYILEKRHNINTYWKFTKYLFDKHPCHTFGFVDVTKTFEKYMYANKTITLNYQSQYTSTRYMAILELEAYDLQDIINSIYDLIMLLLMFKNSQYIY